MLYEIMADMGRTEDVDLDGDGIAETRRPEIKIMTVEASTGDEAAAKAMTLGAKFVRGVSPAKVQPAAKPAGMTAAQVDDSMRSMMQAIREMGDRAPTELHVKDFGAAGDGVTDDSAAVQATMNAAVNAPPRQAAKDLLARADGMHHKTLAAAAAKILGDATPSTKAEIIAALHAKAA